MHENLTRGEEIVPLDVGRKPAGELADDAPHQGEVRVEAPLERGPAQQYASWFRALADPTRVQIVSLLARSGGPLTVGAITDAVDVGQSTVSAHLKVLAGVGFVLAEKRGTSVCRRIFFRGTLGPDPQAKGRAIDDRPLEMRARTAAGR